MQKKRLNILPLLVGSATVLTLFSMLRLANHHSYYNTSVFSWFEQQLNNPRHTFKVLEENGADTIFQFISSKSPPQSIQSFITTAVEFDKEIFFLTGEPTWALDPQAKELSKIIDQIADSRNLFERSTSHKNQQSVKGVAIDVEPYLLPEFKKNPQRVMASYVRSMEKAYQVAKANNLEVIVCVPYFFDSMGFTDELETLIRDASDQLAVMNYYRNQEIEHLQGEAQLSRKHKKDIINIYELQPPGEHDLTDQNTYYRVGITAAYKNFDQLMHAFKPQKVHLSFHEFRYFEKLSQRID